MYSAAHTDSTKITRFIIAVATTTTAPRYFSLFLMVGGMFGSYNVALAWISSTFARPRAKRAAAYAIINSLGNGTFHYPSLSILRHQANVSMIFPHHQLHKYGLPICMTKSIRRDTESPLQPTRLWLRPQSCSVCSYVSASLGRTRRWTSVKMRIARAPRTRGSDMFCRSQRHQPRGSVKPHVTSMYQYHWLKPRMRLYCMHDCRKCFSSVDRDSVMASCSSTT